MKTPHPRFLARLVLAVTLATGVLCPLARAADSTLVDFAGYHRDPDGTTSRPYEYAYNDWNKCISAFRNQGTLIKAPSGKGVIGDNHALLDLGTLKAVELVLVIGNGNSATTLSFLLEDKDGTGHVWNLALADKPRGRDVRFRLELNKPDSVNAPGKNPGFNQKKISVWQLRGDYSAPNVEVLAIKLVEAQ